MNRKADGWLDTMTDFKGKIGAKEAVLDDKVIVLPLLSIVSLMNYSIIVNLRFLCFLQNVATCGREIRDDLELSNKTQMNFASKITY